MEKQFVKTWASDSTASQPPAECPTVPLSDETFWERMQREFRELQKRGW